MKYLKLSLALLLLPFCCAAWDGAGHSTCGAIAYYYLKAHNPAVIAKVVKILQQHPWYNDNARWGGKLTGLADEQRDVMLFMLASTFPDDARGVHELGDGEKSKWHYVDYPFVPRGSTATGKPPETPNAEQKINEFIVAISKEHDPAQKAIDLCWLFHLIEDVHQPLHSVLMLDNNHPDGDKGGNTTFIVLPGATKGDRLHWYWDDLIKGDVTTAPAKAQELLAQPAYQDAALWELAKDKTVGDWIQKESFVIATQQVYDNGRINGTKESPTPVDEAYVANAAKTGERRVVLAGIRVAKTMVEVLHD